MVQTKLLKARIVASGMSRKELAKMASMSNATMSAKINGKRPFTTDEVVAICNALGINEAEEKVLIFLQ